MTSCAETCQGDLLPSPGIAPAAADPERSRRYGRARFLLCLTEFGVLVGVLALLTLTGAARALLEFCATPGEPLWLQHLAYLLMIGVLTRAALFPVQLLNEFWLEHRFGLSFETFPAWFWHWLCRSALFGVVVAALLLPVADTLRWWPYLFPAWCVVFLLVRPFLLHTLEQRLLNCFYPVRFLRHETFTVPGLGKTTLPVYEVQVSHRTRRAEASIQLRGKRSAIYVTDTLIEAFSDGEERVVIAHEFGHLYDREHLESRTAAGVAQAQRKLMLGSVQVLAGAIALLLMQFLAPRLGLAEMHDLAGFPLLAGLTLALATAISPLLYAEARQDERDADCYALAATGDVQNYVSVMHKLRQMNLEESDSSPWSRLFFDTHPSYAERIRLALEYRRRLKPKKKPPAFRGWRHVQRHGRR